MMILLILIFGAILALLMIKHANSLLDKEEPEVTEPTLEQRRKAFAEEQAHIDAWTKDLSN